MNAPALDKRLRALEAKNTRQIATLADYALWGANPNRDPNPQFSPVMQKCLEDFRKHTMEKGAFGCPE
jgi:hypothetical protein